MNNEFILSVMDAEWRRLDSVRKFHRGEKLSTSDVAAVKAAHQKRNEMLLRVESLSDEDEYLILFLVEDEGVMSVASSKLVPKGIVPKMPQESITLEIHVIPIHMDMSTSQRHLVERWLEKSIRDDAFMMTLQ